MSFALNWLNPFPALEFPLRNPVARNNSYAKSACSFFLYGYVPKTVGVPGRTIVLSDRDEIIVVRYRH